MGTETSSEVVRFAPLSEVDGDLGLLTAAELARHGRLIAEADKQAYAAAHVLVRECAAELLGTTRDEVRIVQRCARCGKTEHGAPSVAGSTLRVSLSHTRGYVAAVAATRPCGIDVETVSRGPDRALSPREAAWVAGQDDAAYAFTRLWVRKEALVKAGHGDMAAAQRIDVLVEQTGTHGKHGEMAQARSDQARAGLAPAEQVGDLGLVEWSDVGFIGAVAVHGLR
ncbi:MAG: 4'-phosphopantetheinyl transferase family protein [Nocardioides sp.]|uniref:4'-phosphopantetheinyl transferase family protein n=1 Tax=Nocardioides sp. TaxID=35761 RepID=UPI003D6B1BA7